MSSEKIHRFYQGDRPTTEFAASGTRSIFRHRRLMLAQCSDVMPNTVMAVSGSNSVMSESHGAGTHKFSYTPYGQRPVEVRPFAPLAFNGELLDQATSSYFLGNGRRLFSPALRRFVMPDSFSPFDKGGLNAYAYCANDPINRVDPSGRFFRPTLIHATGLIFGALAVGSFVAGALAKSDSTRSTLYIAGTVIGLFLGIAVLTGPYMRMSLGNGTAAGIPRLGGVSHPVFANPLNTASIQDDPPRYDDLFPLPPSFEDAIKLPPLEGLPTPSQFNMSNDTDLIRRMSL